jgi:uncharacterized protein with HEPN domain
MNKALRVPDYLEHILQALHRIARYTAGMDEQAFLSSELVQDAVLRNIEILGEASKHIQRVDPGFAACHADVPWQVMYTMRNRVSHGYDTVDLEIVWKSIQGDLPILLNRVQSLVESGHSTGATQA